jgi:hypothetical protein
MAHTGNQRGEEHEAGGSQVQCQPGLHFAVHRWLTPVILATQKAEIRRVTVQSQPRQTVPRDPISKTLHKNMAGIKERQSKTTLRFYLTPVRIAIIKNITNNRCWQGCGEK